MCRLPINLDLNPAEVAFHTQRAVAATIATTTLIRLNKKVSTVSRQKILLMVETYQVNKDHSREEKTELIKATS
jgi:hypothetical protein